MQQNTFISKPLIVSFNNSVRSFENVNKKQFLEAIHKHLVLQECRLVYDVVGP